MHRVCLVGAGKVSHMHAAALACVPDVELAAVCDIDGARARGLAEQHRIPHVFTSLDDALASATFDFAHVLVSPELHLSVAQRLIDARISVLVEKPMGLSKAECSAMLGAAERRGVQLGVNHNSVFYPAYLKLREAVVSRSFGRLQHLIVVVNHPTSWLNQPGHWKLQDPRNMAYEAAVHPLSQVHDLAGAVISAETLVSGRHDVGPGRHFYDTWQMSFVCERASAQVLLSHGEYEMYQLVAICQDGVLSAEVEQNRFTALDRTRWGPRHDPFHIATAVAVQELGSGLANVGREAASRLRPGPRSDIYFASMKGSIAAFHAGPSERRPSIDGHAGMAVVALCDAATADIAAAPAQTRRAPPPDHRPGCDVVVLGGTTAIRTSLVEQLLAHGLTVRVMVGSTAGLPPLFEAVQLFEGHLSDPDAVSDVVEGAGAVVQIGAIRGAASDESSMLTWATRLTEACRRSGVDRLIHVGSIDSLDLADSRATITGATPNDPRARERGAEVWEKARSEELIAGAAAERSLPLCVLRPAITLGAGVNPFDPGFGNWRSQTHCLGWSDGRNPLPLVLASDVAAAIVLALESEAAVGRTYNLVGPVRLSARECVAELRRALERPLVFHPVAPLQRYPVRACKWLIKTALRRSGTPFPSYHAVRSLGCFASFDCSDVETDLGWKPVADRAEFIDQGLRVHGRVGGPAADHRG